MDLTNYVKAGFPLISIQTEEIKRCIKSVFVSEPFKKYAWNALEGIKGEYTGVEDVLNFTKKLNKSIVCLENFNWFLGKEGIQQAILNNLEMYKNNQVCLIIIDKNKINPFFDKISHKLDFALPKADEFKPIIENFAKQINQILSNNEIDVIAKNLLGLSFEEAENAIAFDTVSNGRIDVKSVGKAKQQIINSSGFMTIQEPEKIENIGGLVPLKRYIKARLKAYEQGNKHMPKLKELLLVGIPGAGKSLVAKALANIFQFPLISANIGQLKNSLVGETEKNTKRFTDTVDSIGNAVILLDEVEKMFGNVNDSGVSQGQMGHFLTWLNDRKSEAIIVATANNLSSLPPEFLRAGRWDCIFFVDYPNIEERKEIIKIMNKKHKTGLDESLAERLEFFSGAEIEQLAKDSHFDDVDELINNMATLYRTQKDKILDIKAKGKNYRKANSNVIFCSSENQNFSRVIN